VVSGNVSFYNETRGQDIFPTPIVGMVGVVDDLERMVTAALQTPGDLLLLLGETHATTLGGSEYAALRSGRALGPTPPIDLDLEARVQSTCLAAIQGGLVRAAHDIADGGLAVALAELCIAGGLGAWCDLAVPAMNGRGTGGWERTGRADVALFGEGGSRILLEVAPEAEPALRELAVRHEVPCIALGRVTDDGMLSITLGQADAGERDTAHVTLAVAALREQWEGAIPWVMR
jgi:phosphoribosylformylglycinamidine synthase